MESVETQEHQGKVLTLSVYEIDTNPDQPRKPLMKKSWQNWRKAFAATASCSRWW